MKLLKSLAVCLAVTCISSITPFYSVMANAEKDEDVYGYATGEHIWQQGGSCCPIAGLYVRQDSKSGDKKLLILPNGKAYMCSFSMSPFRTSITGSTNVICVDTPFSPDAVTYDFYMDLKSSVDPDGNDVFYDKEFFGGTASKMEFVRGLFKTTIREQANVATSGLSSTYVWEQIADYRNTKCYDFLPGNAYETVGNQNTVDVTDLSAISLYTLKDYGISDICAYNADMNFDGKVGLDDLATLRQYLSKKKDTKVFIDSFYNRALPDAERDGDFVFFAVKGTKVYLNPGDKKPISKVLDLDAGWKIITKAERKNGYTYGKLKKGIGWIITCDIYDLKRPSEVEGVEFKIAP